jgi:acyl-CoA synthetase (AMP-forming)/AMP-acid ligase II
MRAPTIVHLLQQRAAETPDAPAFTFLADGDTDARTHTWASLDRRAREIASALAPHRGERWLLVTPQGLSFLEGLFGALYAGVVAIPLQAPDAARPERALAKIRGIVARDDVRGALVDGPGPAGGWGLPSLDLADLRGEHAELPAPAPDDVAWLQYTSGSTADPKGVIVRHRNLTWQLEDFDRGYDHGPSPVIVSWLPLFHDLGLVYGAMMPVWTGGQGILLDPMHFLQRPARWLWAVHRYRGTHTASPNFSFDLAVSKVSPAERAGLDLSCWKLALNGAEPIRKASEDRFVATYAAFGLRPTVPTHAYGMSETTAKIATETVDDLPGFLCADGAALERGEVVEVVEGQGSRWIASCGRTTGDTRVVAADPDTDARLPDRRVGELRIAGNTVCDGYFARPEDASFGTRLRGEDEPVWFRTGDLGFTAEGRVFVTGRLKDMILLRGENHYPQDIEWAVQEAPGVRPGGAAAFGDDLDAAEALVVVAEVTTEQGPFDAAFTAIRARLADLGLAAGAIALVRARGVPKTSSGKVQRRACRQWWRDGAQGALAVWRRPAETSEIATMSSQFKISEVIRAIVAHALGVPDDAVPMDAPWRELGLDSVQVVEVAEAISARTSQDVGPTDMFRHPTPNALIRALTTTPAPAPPIPSDVLAMTEAEVEAALLRELEDL